MSFISTGTGAGSLDKAFMKFKSWDSNNDGKIDANELLSEFDTDHDGTLGKDEIQHFAEQLSAQLEFNNSLLQQLHTMEEGQSSLQREIQGKQEALQRVLKASEDTKCELTDTKRKLKVAQEVSDNMTKQAREVRADAAALKQELETSIKNASDMKAALRDLTDEKAKLQRSLVQVQANVSDANEALARKAQESKTQIDALQSSKELLSSELSELRGRIAPIEAERKALRDHVLELTTSFEELTARLDRETAARMASEKKEKDASLSVESLRESLIETQHRLDESEHRLEQLKSQQQEVDNLQKTGNMRVEASEKESVALRLELQKASEELTATKRQVQHMEQEITHIVQQRQSENDRWAAKLVAVQAEMGRVVDDTKSHCEDLLAEARKKISDLADERRQFEAMFHNAKEESLKANDLLERSRQDHQACLDDWNRQKADLDANILSLKKAVTEREASKHDLHASFLQERDQISSVERGLRQEMAARGEKYLQTLSTLQEAIRTLRKEAISRKDQQREISGQLQLMRNFCAQLYPKAVGPIMQLKPEMLTAFAKLVSRIKTHKDAIEDHKDDISRLHVNFEEERSKSLMLEEHLSRLDHEKNALYQELNGGSSLLEERLGQCSAQLEQNRKEKDELEGRMQRLQATLDSVSNQARTLQEANQTMQSTLRDMSAQQAAAIQESEGKAMQLANQVRRLTSERDTTVQQTEDSRKQLLSAQAETAAAKSEIEQIRQELNRRNKEAEDTKSKHQQTLSTVGGATQQYQQQLKQTQELLKVVQSQRSELQAQNQSLRTELDRLNAARLTGAAS